MTDGLVQKTHLPFLCHKCCRMKKTNAMRLLDQQKIVYRSLEYTYSDEDLSVNRIAADNGLDAAQVFKTLVLQDENRQTVVAVIPGNAQLDFKNLARLQGCKSLNMAPTKDLLQLTGYQRGGCSPFGMKKVFPVWIDEHAQHWSEIFVNAGQRGLLLGLSPGDLHQAAQAQWAPIALLHDK
jgi:Cys-tRNA(Pro)/Cys-tRNA(Cys) deacylase